MFCDIKLLTLLVTTFAELELTPYVWIMVCFGTPIPVEMFLNERGKTQRYPEQTWFSCMA